MADNDNVAGATDTPVNPAQPTQPSSPDTKPDDKKPNEYKKKFRATYITDAGRHMIGELAGGQGTLVYTRAVLSKQAMTDKDGNPLDDEIIRATTKLNDVVKEGNVKISPIVENDITVTGSFSNKDQDEDIKFSTIGWFARIDHTSGGGIVHGQEILYAITPTVKPTELLPAGPPDHRSTQVITADITMQLANATKVDITINETGLVYQSDLEAWIKKVQDWIASKIDNISIMIGNSGPYKPDASGKFNLPVYTAQQVDSHIRKWIGSGSGSGINPNKPVDTDSLSKDEFNAIHQDYSNRITYLANNAVLGQRFTDVPTAQKFEKDHPSRIGILKDIKVPAPQNPVQADVVKLDTKDDNGHYTSDQISAILSKLDGAIRDLEGMTVIGKHFTDKSEAKTWAAQHQDYLAYIETAEEQKAANNEKKANEATAKVASLFAQNLAVAPQADSQASGSASTSTSASASASTSQASAPTQPTTVTEPTQPTQPIDANGNVMYYTKGEFNKLFQAINDQIKFLRDNALMSKHFDSQIDMETWERKQCNYLGFTDD